jgi:hypothetical protein
MWKSIRSNSRLLSALGALARREPIQGAYRCAYTLTETVSQGPRRLEPADESSASNVRSGSQAALQRDTMEPSVWKESRFHHARAGAREGAGA